MSVVLVVDGSARTLRLPSPPKWRTCRPFVSRPSYLLCGSAAFSTAQLSRAVTSASAQKTAAPAAATATTIVDLRKESHFALDGMPVSFFKIPDNSDHAGRSDAEVAARDREYRSSLQGLVGRGPVSLFNAVKEQSVESRVVRHVATVPRVTKVMDPAQAVKSVLPGAAFVRAPIDDHGVPGAVVVQRLLDLWDTQARMPASVVQANIYHCRAGRGRTTLVMAMCQLALSRLLGSAKEGSMAQRTQPRQQQLLPTAESVARFQARLGGKDLLDMGGAWDSKRLGQLQRRAGFLRQFARYCDEQLVRPAVQRLPWSMFKADDA